MAGEINGKFKYALNTIQAEILGYFKKRKIRPALWTFLIDKYRGISQTQTLENVGAFSYTREFYDELHIQYLYSEEPNECKFLNPFGEYEDMMRYKSIMAQRLPDSWGCLRNNPTRSQCKDENCDQITEKSTVHHCKRGIPNIWVQVNNAAPPKLATEYLDAIQNKVIEDGLPVPLEKIGNFFFPNLNETEAAILFAEKFHLTDEELTRLFSYHEKPAKREDLEKFEDRSQFPKSSLENPYLIFVYGGSMYTDTFDAYGFHYDTPNADWVEPGVKAVLYCSSSYPKKEMWTMFVGVAQVKEIKDVFEELEKEEWIVEKLRTGKASKEELENRYQEMLRTQKYQIFQKDGKEFFKKPAKSAVLRRCLYSKPISSQDFAKKYSEFEELYRSSKDGRLYISMPGIARLKEKENGRSQKEWFELFAKEGGCEEFLHTYSLQDLKDFLDKEMKISEIYQPFIIMQLLIKQDPISVDLLVEETKKLENYKPSTNLERSFTREPPKSQLVQKRFVTFDKKKNEYSLNVQYKPTESLIQEIIVICEKKIQTLLKTTPPTTLPSPSEPPTNTQPLSPSSPPSKLPILPFTSSLLKNQVDPILKGISNTVYQEISTALNVGHHLILTGPPGTGKTTFAKKICELAAQLNFCDEKGPLITTATSDWTSFDTIGGYMPSIQPSFSPGTSSTEKPSQSSQTPFSLSFQENIFLQAIRENRWLVIDEINRAEIDKAFGPLLTVLSEFPVTLPFKRNGKSIKITANKEERTGYFPEEERYNVGKYWRIIGTMNIYDKHMLYDLSYAFMRRFAFVDVDIPDRDTYRSLIEKGMKKLKDLILSANNQSGEVQYSRIVNLCLKIFFNPDGDSADALSPLQKYRKIGPAILNAIMTYIDATIADWEDFNEDRFKLTMAQAIDLFLVPQFEGLRNKEVVEIYKATFEQIDSESKIILNRLKNVFSDAIFGD